MAATQPTQTFTKNFPDPSTSTLANPLRKGRTVDGPVLAEWYVWKSISKLVKHLEVHSICYFTKPFTQRS